MNLRRPSLAAQLLADAARTGLLGTTGTGRSAWPVWLESTPRWGVPEQGEIARQAVEAVRVAPVALRRCQPAGTGKRQGTFRPQSPAEPVDACQPPTGPKPPGASGG